MVVLVQVVVQMGEAVDVEGGDLKDDEKEDVSVRVRINKIIK